jgi:hypothetical protein
MNFSKFDVVMVATMALAVISMSFVMPALGLTTADAEESEIPEFSVNSNAFDLAGDMPDSPGVPGQGTLTMTENNPSISENFVDLDSGVTMLMLQEADVTDPEMEVMLTNGSATTSLYFNESPEGAIKSFDSFGYGIDVELASVENRNESTFTWSVDWKVTDEPTESAGFLDRIPIVGGVVGAGEALAQIVGWIGSLVWWGIATIFEVTINVLVMIAESMLFLIETGLWLTQTYADVVSAASSWASIFVAVPGLILFMEFAKAVMIGISLLPTT